MAVAPGETRTRPVMIHAAGYVLPHLGPTCSLGESLPPAPSIRPSPKLDTAALAEIACLTPREAKKLDRFSMLAIGAAHRALGHICASDFNSKWGIIISNTLGGWEYTERELSRLHQTGAEAVSPYLATAWFPAAPQGQISLRYPIGGFSKTICGDRCGGAVAIQLAARYIQLGRLDFALAGGVDAPLSSFVLSGFKKSKQDIDLVEGAGFVVLGPATSDSSANEGGNPAPASIAGAKHIRLSASSDAALAKLVQVLKTYAADSNFGAPQTLVCSGLKDEALVAPLTRELESIGSNVVFAEPWLHDSLSATSALGLIMAYERFSNGTAQSSVWHLCIDRLSAHLTVVR